MRHIMKRALLLAVLLVLSVFVPLRAQTTGNVQVTRNVNLRSDPSTTHKPIELLRPPEKLELIDRDARNGYYHVRTEEGEEGWVWGKNIRLIEVAEQFNTLTETAGIAASPATHVSSSWNKGTPTRTTFHGKEGVCPYYGNDFDPDQYTLKNRTDVPNSYHDVTWSAIDELDYPGKSDHNYAPMHRKDWIPSQLAVIAPYENVPVRVVGYIVAIKPQNGSSGEGTNCKFNKAGDVDTHMALVEKSGDAESQSVVIEWTPRFLKAHPNWTKAKLLPWLDSDQPVRVSGWLMLDPDHVNHLGTYRDTLWEIHPITKFEVFKDGKFVDMDKLK
jgi:hypothetical protein